MGKMPEAQNFLIPPRMFESDTLLFLFYYVCVSQSSFNMNFKLNELFYNIFLMF